MPPYPDDYDAAVFTLESFVPPEFPVGGVEVIPSAMNPMSPKDIELDLTAALQDRAPALIAECEALIARAVAYSKEHLEYLPESRDWVWTP